MKKLLIMAISVMLLFTNSFAKVMASEGVNTTYYSYTYNEDCTDAIAVPAPYSVELTVDGESLGIGNFNGITDVYYEEERGLTYITDSGNSRIIILNADYTLLGVLQNFQNEGVVDNFSKPNAVFVKDQILYVSDTEHHRIVAFDKESLELVNIIQQPEIKLLGEYTFLPKSFAVDLAGRFYIIAQNINEGIVQLDAEGNFERFVGAPDVTLTWAQKLWRIFLTEKQKEQMEKAVPTEYNSIRIDQDGFLYLTTQDTSVPPITKLNCQGNNVLRVNTTYEPQGDTVYYNGQSLNKSSSFVDIAVRADGIYAALDSSTGRIFVYDQEGVLLYCFGGNGAQEGVFRIASGVEMFGDNIIVTDGSGNTVTVFSETDFGKAVDLAVTAMLDGRYEDSATYWQDVLRQCPNYDYAYMSLARTDIQAKDFDVAMERLQGTGRFNYYYKAFEGVRKEFISDNFTLIFLGIIVLVFLVLLLKKMWKRFRIAEKLGQYTVVQELKYSNHVMFHPIDGFWDVKREKRGSLRTANILAILFVVLYGIRAQWSGYCFTQTLPEDINAVFEVAMMVLPLAMWVVSNWCFTSLMDGEGTMKDIYIATAYALKPYIITAVPMLILSRCLSGNEAFIYQTFDGIIMVWMLGLVFFGMMITHNYSLGKAVATAILTLIGICLMMFLILVCFNILQDMFAYGTDIYKEIIYRMY